MTEKKLRKLRRVALIELLIEQIEENDRLTARLAEANEQLRNREITIQKAGSIAEAALLLNDVFSAAERAASEYVENVARLSAKRGEPLSGAEQENALQERQATDAISGIAADIGAAVSRYVSEAAGEQEEAEAAQPHDEAAGMRDEAAGGHNEAAGGHNEAAGGHNEAADRYAAEAAVPGVDPEVEPEKEETSDDLMSRAAMEQRFDEVFAQMRRRNKRRT